MKIAFILSNPIYSLSNGVISQALTWKKGLEILGHEVVLIDMWHKNDWNTYDIIQFFWISDYSLSLMSSLALLRKNIVIAPILDPDYSILKQKIYAHVGSRRLGLSNRHYALTKSKEYTQLYLVRSKLERKYLTEGYNIDPLKCDIVPLSFDVKNNANSQKKEDFCLHISLLMDERKNVHRLIEAAKKYKFRLVLGGKLRNEREKERLYSWINNSPYIEYRGFLAESDLLDLYNRARVFALPSTNEGVGIVALEAASMGCDIVMTSLGGPKEYYKGMAKIVNPYSIDEIGEAVTQFFNGDTYQPLLSHFIKKEYSLNRISKLLEASYMKIIDI